MDTPTLYLDCLILAAAAYPAGFSHSLFTLRRGTPGEISTAFLVFLAGPYLAVTVAVLAVRSGLVACKGTTAPLLALAALAAPAALSIEVVIHSLVSLGRTGRLPAASRIELLERWFPAQRAPLTGRPLALGADRRGRGDLLPGDLARRPPSRSMRSAGAPLRARDLSSMAYGLNHLAFGATAVVSKSATGVLYGLLYRLGGGSVWLPFAAHALQNLLLFRLAGRGGGPMLEPGDRSVDRPFLAATVIVSVVWGQALWYLDEQSPALRRWVFTAMAWTRWRSGEARALILKH